MIPNTPTTAEVATNLRNQLQAKLSQTIPLLPKAALDVMAKVLAGVFILLWKYAGWIFLQLFVPYASTSAVTVNGRTLIPLVEWGRLFGLGDPLEATRAVLNVTLPVTNQTGSLPGASQFIHPSSGVLYVSTQAVLLNAATVTVRVRAADDQTGTGGRGTIGNRIVGDVLSLVSPLPNVARDATVASVVTTAAEGESWEAYRSRVLEFAQARPQGGAHADYRFWARQVPGIIAAYPYAGDPGEVDLYVEATAASSGSQDGIPTSDQLEAVENACRYDIVTGSANRMPVTAGINVMAIVRQAIDVDVSELTVDDPETVKEEIGTALDDYLRALEPFIVGLSVLPRRDRALVADMGGIVSDIVRAAGGTFGVLTMTLGLDTLTAYTLAHGEKTKSGGVTFDGA